MSDLIKREDVLHVLLTHGYAPIDGLYQIIEQDIPSADRPQGKWIETDRTYFGATVFKCSVCCDEIDEMPTVMGVPKYKYCPYCGIKMKGADDE